MNARVACPIQSWRGRGAGLGFGLGGRVCLFLNRGLYGRLLLVDREFGGRECLRGAANEDTVLLESLDQPVVGSIAGNSALYTSEAEIKVIIIALGAVVVDVRYGSLAAVAADSVLQN